MDTNATSSPLLLPLREDSGPILKPKSVEIPTELRRVVDIVAPLLPASLTGFLPVPVVPTLDREVVLDTLAVLRDDGRLHVVCVGPRGLDCWSIPPPLRFHAASPPVSHPAPSPRLVHVLAEPRRRLYGGVSGGACIPDCVVAFTTHDDRSNAALFSTGAVEIIKSIRVSGDIIAFTSSAAVLAIVTPTAVHGYSNTPEYSPVFILRASLPSPQPSGYIRTPTSIAVGSRWIAMLSASSASSASDATSASLPTAAEITSTVVSAMYRVSDWAVSAVGDRLRSTASPSASSLPEQSCASSVALYDALTGEVVTEFKPHGDNGVSAVAFDTSGGLLATASGDGQLFHVYSLSSPSVPSPSTFSAHTLSPSLLCTCWRGVTRAVITDMNFRTGGGDGALTLAVSTVSGTTHCFQLPPSLTSAAFGRAPKPTATVTLPPPPPPPQFATGPSESEPASPAATPVTLTLRDAAVEVKSSHRLMAVTQLSAQTKLRDSVLRAITGDQYSHSSCIPARPFYLCLRAGLCAVFSFPSPSPSSSSSLPVLSSVWDLRRPAGYGYSSRKGSRESVPGELSSRASTDSYEGREPGAVIDVSTGTLSFPPGDALRAHWCSRGEPSSSPCPFLPLWRSPLSSLALRRPLPEGARVPVRGNPPSIGVARAREKRLVGVRVPSDAMPLLPQSAYERDVQVAKRTSFLSGMSAVGKPAAPPSDVALSQFVQSEPYFPAPTAPQCDDYPDDDFEVVEHNSDAGGRFGVNSIGTLPPASEPFPEAGHSIPGDDQTLEDVVEDECESKATGATTSPDLLTFSANATMLTNPDIEALFSGMYMAEPSPASPSPSLWLGSDAHTSAATAAAGAYSSGAEEPFGDSGRGPLCEGTSGWDDAALFGEVDEIRVETPAIDIRGVTTDSSSPNEPSSGSSVATRKRGGKKKGKKGKQ